MSATGHDNVIRGSFAVAGQTDIAFLCAEEGASRIVIVWGGTASCPNDIGEMQDVIYESTGADGKRAFSREIHVVGGEYVRQHHEAYGGPPPPRITHDAINDVFVGKGSVVHYCSEGTWLELTGAD